MKGFNAKSLERPAGRVAHPIQALVVGAGIAGLRAALDLAQSGHQVLLIERAPHLGGLLSQLERQFPTNRCGMCRLLPAFDRDAASQFCLRRGLSHERIEIRLNTQITALDGTPGQMQVRLHTMANGVDARRCVGCGRCAEVCPVQVPDPFNAGRTLRKAVFQPVAHDRSSGYVIDPQACTRCGACVSACPTRAIQIPPHERSRFRILVVDDELVVRDSLKEWLMDEGYSVQMAASGPEALDALTAEPADLMLADIKMPAMDGVELLQRARQSLPELRVVMMTAYATVETAVEAMQMGALDYLMKPFDTAALMDKVAAVFQAQTAGLDEQITVGAVILTCGCSYYDPRQGRNPYGYGVCPHVLTQLDFERVLSGDGPSGGKLLRPADRRPIGRIAFLQCVGSRDLQYEADFCSSICCMVAVKQARLARERGGAALAATLFHMDLRTTGLPYQRCCDAARDEDALRLVRGRVHSLLTDARGDPVLQWLDADGRLASETFDLVVLAAGQRPARGLAPVAEMAGVTLNAWGFVRTQPHSTIHTDRDGILAAGACTGLKDISESVIQASAAAAEAGRMLHAAGCTRALSAESACPALRDLTNDPPRIAVALCMCDGALNVDGLLAAMEASLRGEPCVSRVARLDHLCSDEGWRTLVERLEDPQDNRILLGACRADGFVPKLRKLAADKGLAPQLVESVDLRIHQVSPAVDRRGRVLADLAMAVARLRHAEPGRPADRPVVQHALVIGGGIAGLQAALSIAECGFPVTLVEKQARLGGNLQWLRKTLDGADLAGLLAETIARAERHPLIQVCLQTQVQSAGGQIGRFRTTLAPARAAPHVLEHGVAVLATGCSEAPTQAYAYGTHAAVVTQKGLETGLAEGRIDPRRLGAVAMILCVDSRAAPRNYCSRICCPTAVRQALAIKTDNPATAVYVLYRDMMTGGFSETYFTRARRQGIVFIPYTVDAMPRVSLSAAEGLRIRVTDPILAAELEIDADLLVLATGMVPDLPADLAAAYDARLDRDGFFEPADFKWRPVEGLRAGVFACGCALSPRGAIESIATAQAAAQKSVGILMRPGIAAGAVTATVRRSLCSLCQRCIDTCPFGARSLSPERDQVLVNPAMCQGCGACAAACPNGAAVVSNQSTEQMLAMIEAAISPEPPTGGLKERHHVGSGY